MKRILLSALVLALSAFGGDISVEIKEAYEITGNNLRKPVKATPIGQKATLSGSVKVERIPGGKKNIQIFWNVLELGSKAGKNQAR